MMKPLPPSHKPIKNIQRVTIKVIDLQANANSIVNHSACIRFIVEPGYMSQKIY